MFTIFSRRLWYKAINQSTKIFIGQKYFKVTDYHICVSKLFDDTDCLGIHINVILVAHLCL